MRLIPKYQKGDLVARQDNTRVVKSPTFKPIKQRITPKPQFIQDSRTGWQKEVSNQIKSDRAKSEALYKNQHVWNWSNYGSNIRVTPSNASQIYNFNKDAAMGTFAIGTGLANPVATATSLVGSFAGAGIGNQIAGDKGTLVGGLVGGLANPKIIKSVGKRIGKKKKLANNQLVKRQVTKEITKQIIDQGRDYTDRLLLALGDKKDLRLNSTMKFGNLTAEFTNYLKQQGVDISKFTDKDIIRLMNMRNTSVNSNLPESGRFTLITEALSEGIPRYQSELYSGRNNLIGNLSGTIDGTDLKVNSVSKESSILNRETGVSKDLYNSAIQYTNQRGYKGLRTGDLLQSPEITYKVWDKFPDKELVGTFGEHKFNFGQTIRNPELRSKTILDGNVYRLTKPTRFIPTKNEGMFHPSMINPKTGKLNPPDWNSTNIYKAIIPIGVGLNSINYEKEE